MKKTTKKILVIDDDNEIREALKDMLELNGYSVVEATNGVNGLKKFLAEKIDLILLDIFMPRMDGYMFMESLQQVVNEEPTNRKFPPIIVLSAAAIQQDMGFSQNLGAVEFIQKPYENDFVLSRIKHALSKKSPL